MTDTKLTERSLIADFKKKYTPHFNLYQVNCYQKNKDNVQNYYTCIRKVDEQMLKNSDFLRQTFGKIDLDIEKNQGVCKLRFQEDKTKLDECLQKTMKQFKFDAERTYDEFYKKNIGHRSEYKKIR